MIRRKMILYLLALLLVLLLPGSGSVTAAHLTINENNNGETLTLYPGDILELTLESNPTTGFCWQGDLNIAGVLEVVEQGFRSKGFHRSYNRCTGRGVLVVKSRWSGIRFPFP